MAQRVSFGLSAFALDHAKKRAADEQDRTWRKDGWLRELDERPVAAAEVFEEKGVVFEVDLGVNSRKPTRLS